MGQGPYRPRHGVLGTEARNPEASPTLHTDLIVFGPRQHGATPQSQASPRRPG